MPWLSYSLRTSILSQINHYSETVLSSSSFAGHAYGLLYNRTFEPVVLCHFSFVDPEYSFYPQASRMRVEHIFPGLPGERHTLTACQTERPCCPKVPRVAKWTRIKCVWVTDQAVNGSGVVRLASVGNLEASTRATLPRASKSQTYRYPSVDRDGAIDGQVSSRLALARAIQETTTGMTS